MAQSCPVINPAPLAGEKEMEMANEKTEDEIAREKELVQKMIGAKGAMEASLKRIERLESTLSHVNTVLSDMQSRIGEGLYVKTFYHGMREGGEQTVRLRDQIDYARSLIAKS